MTAAARARAAAAARLKAAKAEGLSAVVRAPAVNANAGEDDEERAAMQAEIARAMAHKTTTQQPQPTKTEPAVVLSGEEAERLLAQQADDDDDVTSKKRKHTPDALEEDDAEPDEDERDVIAAPTVVQPPPRPQVVDVAPDSGSEADSDEPAQPAARSSSPLPPSSTLTALLNETTHAENVLAEKLAELEAAHNRLASGKRAGGDADASRKDLEEAQAEIAAADDATRYVRGLHACARAVARRMELDSVLAPMEPPSTTPHDDDARFATLKQAGALLASLGTAAMLMPSSSTATPATDNRKRLRAVTPEMEATLRTEAETPWVDVREEYASLGAVSARLAQWKHMHKTHYDACGGDFVLGAVLYAHARWAPDAVELATKSTTTAWTWDATPWSAWPWLIPVASTLGAHAAHSLAQACVARDVVWPVLRSPTWSSSDATYALRVAVSVVESAPKEEGKAPRTRPELSRVVAAAMDLLLVRVAVPLLHDSAFARADNVSEELLKAVNGLCEEALEAAETIVEVRRSGVLGRTAQGLAAPNHAKDLVRRLRAWVAQLSRVPQLASQRGAVEARVRALPEALSP